MHARTFSRDFNCACTNFFAVQGFAQSLHTSAKAPHACSRLPGNFYNGAVFVGAAYSALGLPQTDRTRKRCRKHKQSVTKVARQSRACAWRFCICVQRPRKTLYHMRYAYHIPPAGACMRVRCRSAHAHLTSVRGKLGVCLLNW